MRMKYLALVFPVALLCLADSKTTKKTTQPAAPRPDMAEMSADAHAPLFRTNKPEVGKLTDRLAASLPKTAVVSAPVPQRNFIDE
jgi:hypothetical protein